MVTVDVGWLKTANGLVMLVNLAAAIAAVTFWEIHHQNSSKRSDDDIYYTCAVVIAMVIVAITFFLTLFGKLTKRLVALVFLVIAGILVIVAIILVMVNGHRTYIFLSMMCSALLCGGIVANLVYTGVGGLKITT